MKTAEQWLTEYSATHQNPLNQRIHKVCVPLIFWSVISILWIYPFATILVFPLILFYFSLGFRYGLAMTAMIIFSCIITALLQSVGASIPWVAGSVFVAAWIGQFYGHQVEGKKPSFFDDILFLAIGPLWTLRKLKLTS